ncbi:MAG: hypothetical protein M3463_19385, partial [Verrucomicrobiota bacterium]|nr:hypothetical protein [Verrucomicrobiota bacterium]
MLHPYRNPTKIVRLLYAATAGQPVKCGEIERAVQRSAARARQPGQSSGTRGPATWPALNREQREAIIASGVGLVDVWETSPVRFEDDESHAERVVDALFPGDPLLCVGQNSYQFATLPRKLWRGRLEKAQLIVPSPMSARTGRTQEG